MNRLAPKLNVPAKVRTRRILKFLARTFWILIAVILIWQLFRLNLFLSQTTSTNLNQASAQVEQLQKELDEIREYLLIPTKTSDQSANSSPTLEQSLAESLSRFQSNQIAEKEAKALLVGLETVTAQLNPGILAPYSFLEVDITDLNPNPTFEILLNQDQILEFGYNGSKLYIESDIFAKQYSVSQLENFKADLINYFSKANLDQLVAKINNSVLIESQLVQFLNETPSQIQTLVDSKNLKIIQSIKSKFEIQGLKSDDSIAFTLKYKPELQQFSLLDGRNKTIASQKKSLQEIFPNLETFLKLNTFETLIEQNVVYKLAQLKTSLNSKQLLAQLKDLNLTYTILETETDFKIQFFHISTKQIAFELILDKQTAELKQNIDNKITRLNYFNDLNTTLDSTQETYLIAGKHGTLTDTLILANVDSSQEKVSLLSIPRDLYVNGAKINSIYSKEGMPKLASTIESISGRKITSYLLIDMYAFIDVIDYLGGVQVHLDAPVSDPTYKTFDNGQWGTMYFTAGSHLLNGKQALRLARSRNTSSDFARAERQQLIIASIRNSLTSLGFKDAKAISQIAATVVNKTETNISVNKAISAFFKYKDYQIDQQNVLSTSNILVSTYSNDYNKVNCKNCGKGAYILIPKNNDWTLLKTYVSSVFNG